MQNSHIKFDVSCNKGNVLLGSQAVVSLVLEREFKNEPVSLVAEEDSGELRKVAAETVLSHITELVKDTLVADMLLLLLCLQMMCSTPFDSGKSHGGPIGHQWILDPIGGTRGLVFY
ncbi:putative SAL3 phosphatase [Raphanus sativus]|nr:putative SAL3 phosphatase [Raphanus sativus]